MRFEFANVSGPSYVMANGETRETTPMAIVIQINANLQWRAEQGSRSDHWIAFCDPLGISTEGASLDELATLIPEAIHVLFQDLTEDNELEGFLTEHGWSSSSFNIESASRDTGPEFRVPWLMSVAGATGGGARQTH
jgi:predicted RNase H-like HicB family nuclease